MGRPDPDTDCPQRRGPVLAPRFEIAWGCDPGSGDGWHSATEDGEHVTAAEWATITAAAQQGEAALDAALTASSAGRAWSAAKTRAKTAAPALLSGCRARYAAWHGLAMTSPWVTA